MKRIFISGNFNVIHTGHLRLLKFAKECGDYLIVGVNSDLVAGSDAFLKQNVRIEALKLINFIDEILLIDCELGDIINEIKPDIVVKGKDFEDKFNIEKLIVDKYGGRLIFSSGESFYSDSDLLSNDFFNKQNITLPDDFLNRYNISRSRLINIINNFNNINVVVIGDLIVDEYINCEPLGISQEDPTIVVTPIEINKFIGGAGIVASHAAGIGAKVDFISVVGIDKESVFSKDMLKASRVNSFLFEDEERPTTLKQRFRAKNKTLLRVSKLHQNSISYELQNKIYNKVAEIFSTKFVHLFVFSDFNYGCLPQKLVDNLISLAKNNGSFVIADSQSSSQMGDISRFKGLNLLTPTEHELRTSLKNREDGLVFLAESLGVGTGCNNIFLKLGKDGLMIHTKQEKGWVTDRINALNSRPLDLAGAGDSMLVTAGMVIASNGNIWESAILGSLASAIQVDRVGNTPLTKEGFIRHLK